MLFDWLVDKFGIDKGSKSEPHNDLEVSENFEKLRRDAVTIIGRGDFAELENLYNELVAFFPRLFCDPKNLDRAIEHYDLTRMVLWRKTHQAHELTRFNPDIVEPFSEFIERNFTKARKSVGFVKKSKPNVAFLTEARAIGSSDAVPRMTFSVMLGQKQINSSFGNVMAYLARPAETELLDFLRMHAIDHRVLSGGTVSQVAQRVLDQCRADDIDILVSDNNNGIATTAFERQAAPKQVFLENGFAAWGITNLDVLLLGVTRKNPYLTKPYVAQRVTPRRVAAQLYENRNNDCRSRQLHSQILSECVFPREAVVFGHYGRLQKITKQYMECVEQILIRNPNAYFYIGGTGVAETILNFQQKSELKGRIYLENNYVDGQIVCGALDVFLDSFPFPGGLSCLEAQIRSVPIVWMDGLAESGFAQFDTHRDPELRARSLEEYVEIASHLMIVDKRKMRGKIAHTIARSAANIKDAAMKFEAAVLR